MEAESRCGKEKKEERRLLDLGWTTGGLGGRGAVACRDRQVA